MIESHTKETSNYPEEVCSEVFGTEMILNYGMGPNTDKERKKWNLKVTHPTEYNLSPKSMSVLDKARQTMAR